MRTHKEIRKEVDNIIREVAYYRRLINIIKTCGYTLKEPEIKIVNNWRQKLQLLSDRIDEIDLEVNTLYDERLFSTVNYDDIMSSIKKLTI